MKIIHIRVKEICQKNFSDAQDWNSIGLLDGETETHIYIKPFKKDIDFISCKVDEGVLQCVTPMTLLGETYESPVCG